MNLLQQFPDEEELKDAVRKNIANLVPKHITKEDIFASINYCMHLSEGIGNNDDIDHLGNRRIRAVGELLQNQYRIGLSRMERVVRERMTTQDQEDISPQSLILSLIHIYRQLGPAQIPGRLIDDDLGKSGLFDF